MLPASVTHSATKGGKHDEVMCVWSASATTIVGMPCCICLIRVVPTVLKRDLWVHADLAYRKIEPCAQ